MSSTPLVSVVMPVWNRADFIDRSIQSILNQTYDQLELIVVDDGSTDGTLERLRSYDDPRVRRIELPANTGDSTPRNVGHAAARGRYIAVMDSDDVALPDRLKTQVAALEADSDLTVCGARATKVQGARRAEMDYPTADGAIKAMLLQVDGVLIHPTAVFRAEFLRQHHIRYDPSFPTDSDHAFFLQIMRKGGRFRTLDQKLLEYHRHGQNTTKVSAGHQARKTVLRERLLPLFYPALDGQEISALAAIMERNRQVSVTELISGIAAAQKALQEQRSFYGENVVTKNRLVKLYADRALKTLERHYAGSGNSARKTAST